MDNIHFGRDGPSSGQAAAPAGAWPEPDSVTPRCCPLSAQIFSRLLCEIFRNKDIKVGLEH